MRIFKVVLKTIKWFLLAILLFVLGCNVYTIIRRTAYGDKMPTVFGFASAVVISPSMEPNISVDDVVLVHARGQYKERDVVMYLDPASGDYITHRIIAETDGGYITQGDNNDSPDTAVVTKENIVGAVFLTLPNAGVVSKFMSSPGGALTIAAVGMAIIFLPDVISSLIAHLKHKNEKEE